MSTKANNIIKKFNLNNNKNNGKGKAVLKTMKKTISLQNDNYQKEIFKKLNEGTILNFVRNSERKETVKTTFSESSTDLKYDLCMINKFDENLNTSLSFISEFDLEDDKNEKDNSFNSLDNDGSVEEVDVFDKNNKRISIIEDEEEHNTKLEKEWNDIQELLLNKTSS
jgi:hypothetical protein